MMTLKKFPSKNPLEDQLVFLSLQTLAASEISIQSCLQLFHLCKAFHTLLHPSEHPCYFKYNDLQLIHWVAIWPIFNSQCLAIFPTFRQLYRKIFHSPELILNIFLIKLFVQWLLLVLSIALDCVFDESLESLASISLTPLKKLPAPSISEED